jgi:hypothetical protein
LLTGGVASVRIDDLAGRVFACAAAAGDWKVSLHFAQRLSTAVDNLADLTITDGATNTDVHGLNQAF